MKLCPMCETWRKSSSKQIAVAICGKCFTVVDNERAMITGASKLERKSRERLLF